MTHRLRLRLAPVGAAALCAGLWSATPAVAAGPRGDPFDTARLAPPTPASAWRDDAPVAVPCRPGEALPARLTLAAAVDLALCRNPRTRESWAAARVAAAQSGTARAATLPSLSASVDARASDNRNGIVAGRRDQATGTLSLNYLLFDFGGRNATVEQARQALLAADWTHNTTLQAVMLAAGQAYFEQFAAEESVSAAAAAEKSARQSLEATEARQKAGTATRADVLQARTALSQTVLARTQAEGEAAASRGALATALGLPPGSAPPLAPPTDVEDRAAAASAVDALIERALDARAELRAAAASEAAARAAVTVESSATRPTVSLFANGSTGAVSPGPDPRSVAVGVTVSVPLFQGHQEIYRVRAARESAARAAASRERLRSEVALEVWRNWQAVRTQSQAVSAAADLVTSAGESYELSLGRYRAGVGNVLDLLTAQTALTQARAQQIQARLRLNVSKLALARAVGTLDPALFTAAR